MQRAKKTSQAKKAAKKTAAAAPKKAGKKTAAAAPKKAGKKTAAAAPKKATKKSAAAAPEPASAPAPKKAAKKTAASKEQAPAPAPKKAAKKTAASKEQAPAPAPKKAAKKTAAAAPEQAPAPAPKKAAKKTAAAPSTGAGDHDAAIARIEAKAAAAGVELAGGASAKDIKAAEKALGAALPEEVVAFYRRHDGADGDAVVEGRELLSLERMVGEWKIWKDLLDQGTFEANDHGRPDPGVQKKWWIAEWVPVTYDGAGNHHVLDLAPAEGGTRGQILSFWHDDDPRTVVAKDFLTWLEGARWGEVEDDYADDGDDDDGDHSDDDDSDDDDSDDDEPEAAGGGDERRFEMDQKFWAIRLDGDSFTVRFGKLGTDGQEQTKSFDDEATARKEHDKLVAAKTKKGYREV